jgi:hypothetical protein
MGTVFEKRAEPDAKLIKNRTMKVSRGAEV